MVFAGPSLSRADARLHPGVEIRPPVASGDLFALRSEMPPVVGIVDGWFGDRRAVGHKEILWLMARGVAVFGAASMGALRAAELDLYGMAGVGEVYRMVRDGRVSDDGDVAVAHGPEGVGFAPLSLALVDVMATADALLAAGRLDAAGADRLIRAARGLHFTDRDWVGVAEAAALPGLDAQTLSAQAVPRKRLDALVLLEAVAADPPRRRAPDPVHPPMTLALRRDLARAGRRAVSPDP